MLNQYDIMTSMLVDQIFSGMSLFLQLSRVEKPVNLAG
jgi:hypothetical protein